MSISFTKYRRVYYFFSGILILSSIISFAVFGLKFGIDFTGGSILELEFEKARPSNQEIEEKLKDFNLGEIVIQPTGEKGIIIRMKEVNEETHQEMLKKFEGAQERIFELIGPSVGEELRRKTETAILLTLLAIAFYIAVAFRKVSHPVPSWQYGIATVIALCHDVIIPLGIFAYLGKFYNVEITIPIVAALLTVLGFSVHDTIVIFDRIRENLLNPYRFASSQLAKTGEQKKGVEFEEIVNWSLNQTLGRSINTVLTVLFVVFSIFFFGGDTLRYFALTLIVGTISGAYSSIFIASPLLVTWYYRKKR
jgi:preprotein translocase subunit SecF